MFNMSQSKQAVQDSKSNYFALKNRGYFRSNLFSTAEKEVFSVQQSSLRNLLYWYVSCHEYVKKLLNYLIIAALMEIHHMEKSTAPHL